MLSNFADTSRMLLHRIETRWDRARFALRNRVGMASKPIVVPYRGYGDTRELWCKGRVIENKGIIAAPHSDSILENIWQTLKRYDSDEIPGAELSWRFGEMSGSVVTDEEGYFDLTFHPGGELSRGAPWQRLRVHLLSARGRDMNPIEAEVCIRTPSKNAAIGVISDIDDTIVETGAYDFLKHWRTVVANSAESRQVFPGVPSLYSALAAGSEGPQTNPVFYVSSSPWNLFDLFERFMILHDIPLGPMLLKDFGLTETKWLTGGHDGHKTAMIEAIFARYPDLSFVLVGDSGQRDALIYAKIAENHPGRVAAVFIREVADTAKGDHMVRMRETLDRLAIPFATGSHLGGAAEIAHTQGWISQDQLNAVQRSVSREQAKE
ncbi:App1 family protein [Oricola cellulosilytica]|uniref:App1 family protein n=1 Tax=Oricola cellulosilytica TaxID=1429082 RepID=UPI001304A608|nr:phosphatase domain-containing protein [Oricola cellulosilytica]